MAKLALAVGVEPAAPAFEPTESERGFKSKDGSPSMPWHKAPKPAMVLVRGTVMGYTKNDGVCYVSREGSKQLRWG